MMKRLFFVLSFVLFSIGNWAQRVELTPPLDIAGVLKTNYNGNKKGTPVTLTKVLSIKGAQDQPYYNTQFVVTAGDRKISVPVKKASKVLELNPYNTEEFWLCQYIDHDIFRYYERKGYRSSMRKEVMDGANDYQSDLNGLFYRDTGINDYLQTIFTGIIPHQINKRRPERLRIEILKSPNPDAYMLANGTLLVSTGLLSTIDSEDELTAIIASEVAHYVLDHQVINVGKERARIRRTQTWGAVLSVVARGVDMLIAENNERYIPGGITIIADVAGGIMNTVAINRTGKGYSKKQCFAADDIAMRFLELNNMDSTALSTALHKIKAHYITEKDKYALSKKGGYGTVEQRIARLPRPRHINNTSFRETTSDVTTFNAIVQLNNKNYPAAERLIEKNIKNHCATDEDYLIFVQANMGYTNSPEDNQRNYELIQHAKSMSRIPNLGLYKQEILLLFRLDQQEKATHSLKEYMSMLAGFKQEAQSDDDIRWVDKEITWSNELYDQSDF